jgi:hypothetical protein
VISVDSDRPIHAANFDCSAFIFAPTSHTASLPSSKGPRIIGSRVLQHSTRDFLGIAKLIAIFHAARPRRALVRNLTKRR